MDYKAAFSKLIETWKDEYRSFNKGQKATNADIAKLLGFSREHLQKMLGDNYTIDEKAFKNADNAHTAWFVKNQNDTSRETLNDKTPAKEKSVWDIKKRINLADVGRRLGMVIEIYTQSDPMNLAKAIGVKDDYIKNVLSGKVSLFNSHARTINTLYGVRKDWLLWGLGEMEEPDPVIFDRYEPIPVLDIDIAAADSNTEMYDDKGQHPVDYLYVPEFAGCTAVNCYSDSMEPLINKGARMFIIKVDGWKKVLEYGQVYVVGLKDGRRFLKYIKRSKEDHTKNFLLVSHNVDYEEFEVPKDEIKSIWMVEGYMNKRTQATFHLLSKWAENRNRKQT